MNVAEEPRAPRMPTFLFQNPKNKSAPNNHSETPKNQLAPRMPKTGYSQKISGPLLRQATAAHSRVSFMPHV
jgi:hypothetical protein